MPSERRDVLHSWCVQADWDAPTVVGGAGARFFSGRRPFDPRPQQPGRMLQSWPPASPDRRRDPPAGREIVLRRQRLGRGPARRTGRTPPAVVRVRRRAGVLHLGGRRRQRARGQVRAPGGGQAGRPDRHPRPVLPWRQLYGHGAIGRQPHAVADRWRDARRAPCAAALCLSLPVRQRQRRRLRPRGGAGGASGDRGRGRGQGGGGADGA